MSLVIYVDGGSRGNPGPAAAGVQILRHDGVPLHEAGYFLGRQTNNAAEYLGLIRALEIAQRMPAAPLAIHSDSELLVRQITGEYRVKNEQLAALYQRVQKLLLKRSSWKIQHVPRERNRRADELANLSMDRGADVVIVELPGAADPAPDASPQPVPAETANPAAAEPRPAERPSSETARSLNVEIVRCDGADETCPAGGCGFDRLTLGATLPVDMCIFAAHAILPTLLAMQNTAPADFNRIPTMTVRCTRNECRTSFALSPARPRNGRGG